MERYLLSAPSGADGTAVNVNAASPAVVPALRAAVIGALLLLQTPALATEATPPPPPTASDYTELRQKITYGQATLAEVRSALTERDPAALTNTVHALYSMRWHRGVITLLYELWAFNKGLYPELAWDLIEKPPVRIALASTLNRIQVLDASEYKTYIRAHENDEHEFHRAQVVVALGLGGDPADVPYLEKMAAGDNAYVAQSAITGLGLMTNQKARDALIGLQEKFRTDPREPLIAEILQKAYHWPEKPGTSH